MPTARKPRHRQPTRQEGETESPADHERILIELVEDIRGRLTEIDALTSCADDLFNQITWRVPRGQRRGLGRIEYMIDKAAQNVLAALRDSERRLSTVMKSRRRG